MVVIKCLFQRAVDGANPQRQEATDRLSEWIWKGFAEHIRLSHRYRRKNRVGFQPIWVVPRKEFLFVPMFCRDVFLSQKP